MKNKKKFITYFGLAVFSLGLFLFSCSKENNNKPDKIENQITTQVSQDELNVDELLSFYYNEYQSNNKSPWGKIWKWILAHSGTHLFENCQGTMSCGPCAGICLHAQKSSDLFIPIEESAEISTSEYESGSRELQIALFNDTVMGFSFVHSEFVYNDSLYIPENFNIGVSASNLFEKDSIIVLKGVYPVSFTHSRNGSTVVNVLSY